MTVQYLAEKLGAVPLCPAGLDNEVTGCYAGDLLSWVMGRAPEKSCWITVMGNVNAVAVAKLADLACILLCEGSHLDPDAKQRSEENGIAVLSSERTAYDLAVAIHGLLKP